jgi:hypothetical protein
MRFEKALKLDDWLAAPSESNVGRPAEERADADPTDVYNADTEMDEMDTGLEEDRSLVSPHVTDFLKDDEPPADLVEPVGQVGEAPPRESLPATAPIVDLTETPTEEAAVDSDADLLDHVVRKHKHKKGKGKKSERPDKESGEASGVQDGEPSPAVTRRRRHDQESEGVAAAKTSAEAAEAAKAETKAARKKEKKLKKAAEQKAEVVSSEEDVEATTSAQEAAEAERLKAKKWSKKKQRKSTKPKTPEFVASSSDEIEVTGEVAPTVSVLPGNSRRPAEFRVAATTSQSGQPYDPVTGEVGGIDLVRSVVRSRDTTATLQYREGDAYASLAIVHPNLLRDHDASARLEALNDPDVHRVRNPNGTLLTDDEYKATFGPVDGVRVRNFIAADRVSPNIQFVYVGDFNVVPRTLTLIELLHHPAAVRMYNATFGPGQVALHHFCPYCPYHTRNATCGTNHLNASHYRVKCLCLCLAKVGAYLEDYGSLVAHHKTCSNWKKREVARVAEELRIARLARRTHETPKQKSVRVAERDRARKQEDEEEDEED